MSAPATLYSSEIIGSSYRPTKGQTGVALLEQELRQNSVRKFVQSTHTPAPNHHPKDIDGERAVSHPQKARTSRQLRLVPLNKHDVANQVAEALRVDFGKRSAKHKAIAEAAGAASENTAKAWTRKSSLPALEYFLQLGRRSPALRAMTMRLWEMEHEMDPAMQKAWIEFCMMMAKARDVR